MLLQFIDFCEHLFMHSSSEELTFGLILLSNILVYRGVNAVAAKQTPYCPISGLSLSPPGLCSLPTKCKHVCRCCVNIALHFNIMTLQELMPSYLLWILVVLWTSSSWLCCRTSSALQQDQAAPICSWMSDFLSDRKQRASLGRHISDSPSTLVLLEAAFLSLYQKLHLSLSISWSLKMTLSQSTIRTKKHKKPRSTEGWYTLYIIISPQTLKELHINKLH